VQAQPDERVSAFQRRDRILGLRIILRLIGVDVGHDIDREHLEPLGIEGLEHLGHVLLGRRPPAGVAQLFEHLRLRLVGLMVRVLRGRVQREERIRQPRGPAPPGRLRLRRLRHRRARQEHHHYRD